MSTYQTHKTTAQGRAETIRRKQVRAAKRGANVSTKTGNYRAAKVAR